MYSKICFTQLLTFLQTVLEIYLIGILREIIEVIMRIALQPAFVLHCRPYRETSLIIDLFTRDYGRVAVVARGVRSSKSRLKPILQPFVPLLVSWHGKGELMTLSAAEGQGAPFWLQGECLLSAFYLNELLVRVLHKYDSYPKLYTIYHETLIELQRDKLEQKTLRIFEKKLLEELGYGLQLQYHIPEGKPFNAELSYSFYPEQGFELTPESKNNVQSRVFLGSSLLALASESLDCPEVLRDAKRLMRLAFAPLLGSQPLHSRKLFIEVQSAK